MSEEIVREVGGRLVFGDAVARIADTLSPLGAAARIVAESGAIAVQLRRLGLEGRRAEAERIATLTRLEHRHAAVGATLHAMHRTVDATERNARDLRMYIANAQRAILKPGVPTIDKEIYRDILKDATAQLVANHRAGGSELTEQIHEVLNGAGATSTGGGHARSAGSSRRDAQSSRSRRLR